MYPIDSVVTISAPSGATPIAATILSVPIWLAAVPALGTFYAVSAGGKTQFIHADRIERRKPYVPAHFSRRLEE